MDLFFVIFTFDKCFSENPRVDGPPVAEGSHEAISPVTANKQEQIVLWAE